jgi:hypothetical protein
MATGTFAMQVRELKARMPAFCDDQAKKLSESCVEHTKRHTPIGHRRDAKTGAELGPSGELRESIEEIPVKRIGNNIWTGGAMSRLGYACVFDSSTKVVVKGNASKRIGDIRVGDLVLTQAGDYQPVLAVNTFPAVEKPNLIDIEVPWRAGKTHRLTVTTDHKVLVFREGRNRWIQAGQLRTDDSLYVRRKRSHAKGTTPMKRCAACGRDFQERDVGAKRLGQGKKYCSQACRDTAWRAGENPHIGLKRSPQTRALLRGLALTRDAGATMNHILAQRGHRTGLEREVEAWLADRGVDFLVGHVIGRKAVDFYIPSEHRIVEADGAFWHRNQDRDIRRDRELLDAMPDVRITHLHFHDPRFSPILDPAPLPSVEYIVCNPGPDSFIETEEFEARRIVSLRRWRYEPSSKPKASAQAQLYDLVVWGVHSFVASGIVISNSYVELGTRAHVIEAKTGHTLHFFDGPEEVWAKRVHHPATHGKHMFRQGLDDAVREWRASGDKDLQELATEVFQ